MAASVISRVARRLPARRRVVTGRISRDRRSSHRADLVARKVYDPVLRSIHAWNALCVTGLLLTGELGAWLGRVGGDAYRWPVHVWLGYGLALGLAARVVWGLLGPATARWRDLWHPAAWRRMLGSGRFLTAPRSYGHHPPASMLYLVFYVVLLTMVLTGLVLAALEQNMGPLNAWVTFRAVYAPLIETPHGFLSGIVLGYIVLHLAALAMHEMWHGIPVKQSMVSGVQYLRRKP